MKREEKSPKIDYKLVRRIRAFLDLVEEISTHMPTLTNFSGESYAPRRKTSRVFCFSLIEAKVDLENLLEQYLEGRRSKEELLREFLYTKVLVSRIGG